MNEGYDQLEQRITEINTEIEKKITANKVNAQGSANDQTIDFLKDQFSEYKDFVNSDRESFMNVINFFFVALGVIITGGTIVLYWIFGQTKTEVKENANLTIRSSINKIEQDAKNKIKSLIDPKIKDFEEKYAELERFMNNQHTLRKSRVLVLCPDHKKEETEQIEVMRIREIVNEVRMMDIKDYENFEQIVSNGEIDLIVYRYGVCKIVCAYPQPVS